MFKLFSLLVVILNQSPLGHTASNSNPIVESLFATDAVVPVYSRSNIFTETIKFMLHDGDHRFYNFTENLVEKIINYPILRSIEGTTVSVLTILNTLNEIRVLGEYIQSFADIDLPIEETEPSFYNYSLTQLISTELEERIVILTSDFSRLTAFTTSSLPKDPLYRSIIQNLNDIESILINLYNTLDALRKIIQTTLTPIHPKVAVNFPFIKLNKADGFTNIFANKCVKDEFSNIICTYEIISSEDPRYYHTLIPISYNNFSVGYDYYMNPQGRVEKLKIEKGLIHEDTNENDLKCLSAINEQNYDDIYYCETISNKRIYSLTDSGVVIHRANENLIAQLEDILDYNFTNIHPPFLIDFNATLLIKNSIGQSINLIRTNPRIFKPLRLGNIELNTLNTPDLITHIMSTMNNYPTLITSTLLALTAASLIFVTITLLKTSHKQIRKGKNYEKEADKFLKLYNYRNLRKKDGNSDHPTTR